MTAGEHERALDLTMRRGTEEIGAPDSAWLNSHLSLCPECEHSRLTSTAPDAAASGSCDRSPSLVAATQMRVRARALQMQEREARTVLIAISFCIGAMSSTMSRGCGGGSRLGGAETGAASLDRGAGSFCRLDAARRGDCGCHAGFVTPVIDRSLT